MYFIVNLPFIPVWRLTLNSPDSEVLQLSVLSEAPTDLNADEAKKFREAEWLISTILLEINQLEGGQSSSSSIPDARSTLTLRIGPGAIMRLALVKNRDRHRLGRRDGQWIRPELAFVIYECSS
jgi:hypothetical protein